MQEGLIRDDYVMIDTVGEGEAITNACATQHYMIVPLG